MSARPASSLRERLLPDLPAQLRLAAAVSAGKLSAAISRRAGRGGGTALPGAVAARVEPAIVQRLVAKLARGSVVVTGTNGKTTTSHMLATILTDAGVTLLRNQSGSNLMRGLASTLVHEATAWGGMPSASRRLGLFEVDEAALPEVTRAIHPSTILLLDLFRDQLDRYGEVATVARIWTRALDALHAGTAVVANADDPLVTDVTERSGKQACFFGVASARDALAGAEHASDVKACPRCGGHIVYSRVTLGHQGDYRCTHCEFHRPTPQVRAEDVRLDGISGSSFRLLLPDGGADVALPLPGMYNVYNALGAAATAASLGVPAGAIASSLGKVQAAFGRMERLSIDGRTVFVALAKNPTGLNEVLRTIASGVDGTHLLMMLNDNIADGRDVSWIWDADVEVIAGRVADLVFSGIRAEDMALRFKYAGVLHTGISWEIEHDTEVAFRRAMERTPPGETLFIVPTYTAMLDIRGVLSRLGYVKPYWEE